MSVLRFTAKVKKKEVHVRGVDLPDGLTVDVTIDPTADEGILTAEEQRGIQEGLREFRRGEFLAAKESIALVWAASRFDRGGKPRDGGTPARSSGLGTRVGFFLVYVVQPRKCRVRIIDIVGRRSDAYRGLSADERAPSRASDRRAPAISPRPRPEAAPHRAP